MTKADIINEIVERTGVGKKDVAAVVEEFMSCIKESMMERKENVYLRGFGSFVVKQRAEKTARNIYHPRSQVPGIQAGQVFHRPHERLRRSGLVNFNN